MYLIEDMADFGLMTTLKRKLKVAVGRTADKAVGLIHKPVNAVMNIGSKKRAERLLASVNPSKIVAKDLPANIDPDKPINMLVHGIGGGDRKGANLLKREASWFGNADKQLNSNSIPYNPKSLQVRDVDKPRPWDFIKTGWNGTRKGGDDDAGQLASDIIGWKKKHPNLKVNVVGHSMGGSISERAGAVLDKNGYGDTVKTVTLGSPASKLKRDKNFKALTFERDKTVSTSMSDAKNRRKKGVDVEQVKNRGSHSTYHVMQNPSILKKIRENTYV
jgi:uncharacterized alpha/beta hydrolase family protein